MLHITILHIFYLQGSALNALIGEVTSEESNSQLEKVKG